MRRITCHSGGAIGSDYFWGEASRIAGFEVKHYYCQDRTPYGNVEISSADYWEGVAHVHRANKTLKRNPDKYMNLLARNWSQVKYSDTIFAIGKIISNGKTQLVDGGTGWAVQMAIDEGKPVYVFDQDKNAWFAWEGKDAEIQSVMFEQLADIPCLTPNFAGIGTRDLKENGKQAIRDIILKFLIDNQITEI